MGSSVFKDESSLICRVACSSTGGDELLSYWDFLPDALVAKILALLPFSSIYLSRSVCQRWRSIIWSPMFMSFCKLRPLRMPWLLEFQQHMYNQAWAYDLEGSQWFHLNFFFLPETAIVLAASRGLVCLGRKVEDGYAIFVCNPLTKDWKKLPPISLQPDQVFMEVDRESGVYKIVILVIREPAGVGYSGSVLVFNARTGDWKQTPYVPEDLCAGNLWDATVSCGVLYCLSINNRMEAFDIDRGFWSPSPYPNHALTRLLRLQRLSQQQDDSVLEDSYLCDRKGRLVMITPFQNIKNVYVNQFDPITRTWRSGHVSSMTNSVICTGRFSSICLSMPLIARSDMYFMHSKGNGHYRPGSKSFHHLPRGPLTRHKLHREEVLVKGLWFEPRLDATI